MTDTAKRSFDTVRWSEYQPYIDVGAALLAALMLRIAWFVVGMRDSAIETNAFDNALIAALFVNPTSINSTAVGGLTFGSLYPTLIAVGEVVLRGGISPPNVGRLISAGVGALLVIPIFFLTQSMYGRRPAQIAAWAVAIHPLLITVSTVVLPTSTFLTLLFAGAWCALSTMISGQLVTAALAGVLFACAALTRLDGLFVAAGMLVAIAVGGGRPIGQNLRRLVVCLATCGAVLLAYRTFVASSGASTATAESFATSRATWSGVFGAIQAFGSPLLVAFAAVGMRHASAASSTNGATPLLALFAGGALASVVSWAHGQTIVVLLPILLIWAASAATSLSEWFGTVFSRGRVLSPRPTSVVVIAALLLAMAAASYRNVQAIPALAETGHFGERIMFAGRWLTWIDPTAKRVMDTSRNLIFYAGASFVPFPPGDAQAAIAAVESANVNFIVVRSTGIEDRPYLKDWFDRGIPDRRARVIYNDQASGHRKLVIYRWAPDGEDLGQPAFADGASDVPKLAASGVNVSAGPLTVSPINPRYFADRSGRVVYLTGFHTWSNLQDADRFDPPNRFDFDRYLSYLQRYRHNFVRLWTTEHANWVSWRPYDLRIEPTPYLRAGPGVALDGKPQFDVSRFNETYFDRLRERVKVAGEHGMYVSVMLFNGWSVEKKGERWENPWRGHPLHRDNNVNGLDGDPGGTGTGSDVHALRDPRIREAQERYVTRVVDAVNDFDNVLFEICNECQDGSVEWQYHMIRFVHQLESSRPKQHPVGMTAIYPTGRHIDLEQSPADWISPNINAGYETDPPASNGNKVIISDTDHLFGLGGDRVWVWKTFTRGINPIFMDGYDYGWVYPDSGNTQDATWEDVRRNLGYTADYAARVDLATMVPRDELSSSRYCLARATGDRPAYLAYTPDGAPLTLDLAASDEPMEVEWFDPKRGVRQPGPGVFGGSKRVFQAPFAGDAVLYVARRQRDSSEPPVQRTKR